MSEPISIPDQEAAQAPVLDEAGSRTDQPEATNQPGASLAPHSGEGPPAGSKSRRASKNSSKAASALDASPPPIATDGVTPDAGAVGPAGEIPDKLYFRIGEVARLAGIKPYVLRFWESEFSSLGPKKSGTGHRLYRRKDVQLVLEIKTLLYEKRFTIEGARKHLETRGKLEPPAQAKSRAKETAKKASRVQAGLFDVPAPALDAMRQELTEILRLLQD